MKKIKVFTARLVISTPDILNRDVEILLDRLREYGEARILLRYREKITVRYTAEPHYWNGPEIEALVDDFGASVEIQAPRCVWRKDW